MMLDLPTPEPPTKTILSWVYDSSFRFDINYIFNYIQTITRVNIGISYHSFGQLVEHRNAYAETQAVEDDWALPQEEERSSCAQEQALASQCSSTKHEPVESVISIQYFLPRIWQNIFRNSQSVH